MRAAKRAPSKSKSRRNASSSSATRSRARPRKCRVLPGARSIRAKRSSAKRNSAGTRSWRRGRPRTWPRNRSASASSPRASRAKRRRRLPPPTRRCTSRRWHRERKRRVRRRRRKSRSGRTKASSAARSRRAETCRGPPVGITPRAGTKPPSHRSPKACSSSARPPSRSCARSWCRRPFPSVISPTRCRSRPPKSSRC